MEDGVFKLTAERSSFSFSNKIARVLWNFCYWIVFRPVGLEIFRPWRSFVLRSFGAKIGENSNVRASVEIWAPWNLEIGNSVSIGPEVILYNQGKIIVGNETIISQKTYLCASSHDFRKENFPLIKKPIRIGSHVWIAADAFVGPGVLIENGAVVGARSAVFKDVAPWTIVGGNPANYIKNREIKQ